MKLLNHLLSAAGVAVFAVVLALLAGGLLAVHSDTVQKLTLGLSAVAMMGGSTVALFVRVLFGSVPFTTSDRVAVTVLPSAIPFLFRATVDALLPRFGVAHLTESGTAIVLVGGLAFALLGAVFTFRSLKHR